MPWIHRILSRGDDFDPTSTTRNGSGSRLYVNGGGHLVWTVSFDWSLACTWILSRNVPFSGVLTYCSEVIICDFLDGMEVVSLLDIIPQNQTTLPWHRPDNASHPQPSPPRLPSGWRGSPPDLVRSVFEAFSTGNWYDQAPGEIRVQPDYSGFVTFYDTSLTSLVEARYGKEIGRAHV